MFYRLKMRNFVHAEVGAMIWTHAMFKKIPYINYKNKIVSIIRKGGRRVGKSHKGDN